MSAFLKNFNDPTTQRSNGATIPPTAMTEETTMKAQSTSIHAPCSMLNAQSRKVRSGRRWTAAAAWVLAAGTLLGAFAVPQRAVAGGTWDEKIKYKRNGTSDSDWSGAGSETLGSYKTLVIIGAGFNAWTDDNMWWDSSKFMYKIDSGSYKEVALGRQGGSGHDHYFGWDDTLSIDVMSGLSSGSHTLTYKYRYHDNNGDHDTGEYSKTFTLITAPTVGTPSATTTSSGATVTLGSIHMHSGATTETPTLKYGTSSGSYTAGSGTVTPTSLAANTTAGTLTGTISGLSPATKYYYQWTVKNTAGTKQVAGNFTTAPGAPTISGVSATSDSITFTVNANGNGSQASYKYYVGTSSSGSPTTACTAGSSVTVSTSISPGTTYYIRAKATANSTDSTIASQTVTTKPTKPTITVGTKNENDITITVNANRNGSATTYKYYLGTSSSGTPTTAITAGTATKVESLSPGTTYYVIALATAGGGTATSDTTTTATKPNAPTITDVSATANSITFTVGANGNGSATTYYYDIYTSNSGSPATKTCTAGVPVTANVTSTGAALTENTTYYIRVRGHTEVYSSVTSKSQKTAAGVVAPTITQGTKTIGTTTATLPITVNMGGGATSQAITLTYGTSSGSYGSSATVSPTTLSAATTAGAVTGTMNGLTPGATYYYQWTVKNSAGTTTAEGSFTAASVIALSATSWTYAGSNPTATVSGGGGTGAYSVTLNSTDPASAGTVGVSGTTLTLTPSKAGTFNITVTKAAQGEYAAQSKAFALTLAKGTQGTAVTLKTTTFKYAGSGFTLTGNGGTVGTYSFAYKADGTGKGSVSGSTLTPTKAGTMTVDVTRSGSDLYNARTDTVTVTVNKGNQTVTISPTSATIYVGGATTTVRGTRTVPASGGGAISYASSATGKATVNSSGVVSAVAAGTANITATAAETDLYNPASATCAVKILAQKPSAATGLSVTATPTTLTVHWTAGSGGAYTLVQINTADSFQAPADGSTSSTYTANNTTYTSGTRIGSKGYVVYQSSGTSVEVSNLTPGTHYYFAVYSRNGNSGYYAYGPAATIDGWTPANPVTTASATADGKTMVRLSWSKPSGASGTMVVCDGTSDPVNGTTYAAGATTLGGKVLYRGTDASKTLEHVVPAGAAYSYKFYAYSSANAYSEALEKSAAVGSFGADEIVDTFSYTNGVALSGLNGANGWSGAWAISGTGPTIASQSGSSIPQFPNYTEYPANTGNRIKVAMNSDAANFAATRQFPQVTSGTIYAAAIMSYHYAGAKKWCRIALQDGDTAKMAAGRIWESSDDRTIGIDDCNGSRTHGTYELNPWESSTDNDYLVIMKYDFSTKTVSARAYYHGEAVPSEAPTTWHVTKTLSANPSKLNKVSLQAGADKDNGYTGDVYFDEVRVATSWSKLLQQEAVAPNPPTSVTSTADGNEMVRVGWTKNAAGNGVMVLATTDGTTPAAPAAGTAYSQGATVGGTTKVAYKGTGTGADLVVAPGTTVKVAVYSYNGDNLYSTAETPAAVTTGTYESWENLETFSYTNGVQVSASGNSWKGGQVCGDNYWGSSGSGNWIPLKPAEVPGYLVNHVVNYPDSVGNVMCVTNLGDGQNATLNRVVSPSVGGSYNNTIYFAYRMAYRYSEAGKNRWAGLQLVSHVGGAEKTVFVGKAAATDHQYHLGINATGASSPCWPDVGSGGNAYELKGTYDYEKSAYVVVGKIQWTADNVANVFANAFYSGDGNAELPENEPGWGSFGYNGASMGPIDSIQFIAGADSGHGQIGFAYFDELRWGTSWEQLLAGKAPTDVWMDGQTTYVYAGDTVTNAITSTPKGAKQSAQSLIWETANPVAATWEAHAIPAAFYTNKASDTQTEWHGVHLITNKAAVTRYGLGAVSGNGTTVKSQNHGEAAHQKHTYSVKVLPAPTLSSVTGGDFKETIRWTRATGYNSTGSSSSGRTFSEVMVVRYSSQAASTAALPPVDGTTYFPGDVIYYNNDPADARYMTVVYRGSDATSHVDAGLAKNTTYYYAVFTVNNSYYSAKSTVKSATTTGTSTTPVVDGLTTDWVGGASPTKNSAAYSEEEFIWTDKALEGRKDTDACRFADIGEFRVKATASTVYFLLRLTNAPATGVKPTNTYVVVGVDTRTNSASTAMNWLGDESATFVGGGYCQTNAAIHYPERQMAVHYVGGSENTWQVEMYAENGAEWYAPQSGDWAAACSAGNSADPCIEWSVPRADLGLAGVCTGRFTVATFVNSGSWNNAGVGTVRIGNDSCAAVDAMEVVPYGVNDQDGKLGSWDEGLKNGNVNFWADVRFAAAGLDTHSAPTVPSPVTGPSGQGSPLLRWNASSDTDGFVTGYLLEVATNAAFGAAGDLLLYRVNVEGAATTSFQTRTSVSNFYWRVRARDSAGILSAGTAQAYTVTGKTDRDGPLAKLLYVGTNVMAFIENTDGYRDDQEKSGDATSVEDSDLQDGGHVFGFVIEWYDVNGVYATNVNRNTGGCAWNILAEHKDGTPYGRVSPNWDLLIVDRKTPKGTKPAAETVDGKTLAYTWKDGLELPTENGGTETVDCWYIDCGKDAVFTNDCGVTQIINDGNFGLYMTNFVTNAFSFGGYRDGVELYLTVSAEDGCMDTGDAGTSGDAGWYPWPSYSGDSAGSYGDDPRPTVNSTGFCKDGPHRARNVTTNQLLKFYVRDNDVQPPVASTNLWGADATDASGTKFAPSLVVATSAVTKAQASGAWASIPGKLAPVSGAGRDTVYQMTDQVIGRNLTFLFNVYDEYLHSGLQLGAAKTATVSGRTLTNTTAMVRTWDAETGEWVASEENYAGYKSGLSTIWDINPTTGKEAVGTSGTGPKTVLAWDFGTITEENIDSLFGVDSMDHILSYIGTNSAGATNLVQLHLRDRDNNREGDQADAELTFGRLMLTDDDATEPEAASFALLGTGTNMVKFGEVAKSVWAAGPTETFTGMRMGTAQVNESSAITVHTKGSDGATGSASLNWDSGDAVAYMSSAMTGTGYTANSKYFEWALTGTDGARWLVDTLTFKNVVSPQGPTMYALTVQDGTTRTVDDVPSSTTPWRNHGAGNKDSDHVSATSANVYENKNFAQAFLRTPAISMTGVSSGSVTFDAGPYNAVGSQTLKLQAYLNYNAAAEDASKWTDVSGASWTASTIGKTYSAGGKVTGSFDFSAITVQTESGTKPLLECTEAGNTVTFRWLMTKNASDNSCGFTVGSPKVTTTVGRVTETLLETIRVDKNEGSDGDGTYAKTETQISIPFAAQENLGTGVKTFRLYGFRATSSMQNEEAVTAGTAEPDGSGNWGINDLTMQGILSGPKGVEVTDQDVDLGSWTNQVEVMDSIETGYDTERSGLWMQDDGESYAQKVPSFTILYPDSLGGGLGGTEFWSGDFNVNKHAVAALTAGANPDFTATPAGTGWTLANATVETSTTASGKMLSLAGGDGKTGSAAQNFPISEPSGGLASAAVQVTARVRSVLAAGAEGAENHFVLKAEFKNGSGTVLDTQTETIEANRAWKDYTLGPVSLENSLVRSVTVTIAEAGTDGTGLEVDSVYISVGVYAPMSDGTPENGVLGARLMLGTPAVPSSVLSTKTMPLSADESDGWKYGMVAKVYDYDHDRTDDALDTDARKSFRLYDDDEEPPQWGRQFGGPFGVSVNGTPLLSKYRVANGGGTNQVWTLSDHALAEAAGSGAGASIGFHLDFYDYSGWRVAQLQFQKLTGSGTADGAPETVLSGGTMAAAGTLASGYSRTTAEAGAEVADGRDYGSANTPSATVGWTLPVSSFYAANKAAYLADGNVTNAVNAWVTDADNDRLEDSLTTNNVAVGNFRLLDQDQLAPYFRPANSGSPKFRATLIATNVPDFASLTAQATDASSPYALGGYAAHQGATASVAERSHLIYDGQLLDSLLGGNHFVVSADLVDRGENGVGRSNTGLRRGTTKTTTGVTSALEADSFVLNNSFLELVPATGDPITLEAAFAAPWSSSDLETKMGSATRYSSWVWPTNGSTRATATNEVGQWLPSGLDSKAWRLRFNVWDNDMDRDGDQKGDVLSGPTLAVRDDDTTAPQAPASVWLNGEVVASGEITRDNAPWKQSLSSVTVAWTEAVDPEPAGFGTAGNDIKVAGIAGYRLGAPGTTPGVAEGTDLTGTTTNTSEHKVTKTLTGLAIDQGFGNYQLFAVDKDADRAGDALAGAAANVPLALDFTKPTAVRLKGTGTGASTDEVDDPTTQMDITWVNAASVGPDDPEGDKDNYDKIPDAVKADAKAKGRADTDILSPWLTYKVYYREYDPQEVEAAATGGQSPADVIYNDYIDDDSFGTEAAGWLAVTNDAPISDPSAGKSKYDTLGTVGTSSVRVYDLDFDREYLFVVVGVDKAGNEGPANALSWATNNTIKFAVTQGLIRASADINGALPAAGSKDLEYVEMQRITDESVKRGAVLHWMTGPKDQPKNVTKEYDLIYRDAKSFNEMGAEAWTLSGTSRTNWNYQTSGLGRYDLGENLRFYRASYHDRWKGDMPLASEEVYSMNNVVLSEGFNYVSLQGVPWTNTFRGVFGADTDMWPGGSDSADTNGAAVIEFYTPGTRGNVGVEWYFFGKDGKWYKPGTGTEVVDYTDKTDLDADFFARPFSINLPAYDEEDGENWWKTHSEFAVTNGAKVRQAMLWHPIMQVPTNGVVASTSASMSSLKPGTRDGTAASGALVFRQSVKGAAGTYNALSLNLPVSVHPRQLGLVVTNAAGKPQPGQMKAGNPMSADKLYVIDIDTKEVRGNSTMYCDANGDWRYNKNSLEVTGTPIRPNDMLVLISAGGNGKNGATVDWVWTYSPTNFYKPPTRHMGR